MAKYDGEGWFKIQQRIFDSTLWEEDPGTRILWLTLLCEAQKVENMKHWPGCVKMAPNALRRAANLTPEQFEKSMERLLSPDEYSRTNPGKPRLVAIEGGWEIPAFTEYNDPEAFRERQERRRKGGISRSEKAVRDESGKFVKEGE